MSSQRKLAAVLFSDLEGYTRLMGHDESGTMDLLRQNRSIHEELIRQFDGLLLKQMGDGILAEFESAYDAVACAVQIQERIRNAMKARVRMGIHLGDVTVDDRDLFGDGVNIASRIQSIADPGGIYVSESIRNAVRSRADLSFGLIGKVKLKHVDEPQTVYHVTGPGLPAPERKKVRRLVRSRRPVTRVAGMAAVLFAALVLAVWVFLPDQAAEQSAKPVTVVAVLPFYNTRSAPEADYLGFSLADQIISRIAYMKGLVVRPSSAVRPYQGRRTDPVQAGQALDADYVLSGSFLKEGDALRVNVELVGINDKHIVWAEAIEVDFKSVFELQDLVTQKVIEGLQLKLTRTEIDRIRKDVPDDPLAYEYYLRGVSYPRNNEGNRLAVAMFTKSIELDSAFAPAYAQLGKRLHELATFGMNAEESVDRAERNLQKALSLNDELLSALGYLSMIYTERNHTGEAVELTRKMLEISPNDAVARFFLGYIYRYAGMLRESITEMEKAIALDSRNEDFRSVVLTYIAAGQYDKAVEAGKRYSPISVNRARLGHALFLQGKYAEARGQFEQILAREPDGLHALTAHCLTALMDRNPAPGLAAARRFEQAGIVDAEAWFYFGAFFCALGDTESGFRALERAVNGGYFNYPEFTTYPLLNACRDDDAFQAIVEKARTKHEAFRERFF